MPRPSKQRLALRRSSESKELYLHAAPAFLVVLDRGQRVELVSAYGCRVLGYREEQLLGRNWYDTVVSPRDRERLRSAFTEVMAGTRPFTEQVESTLPTRSGESRTVAWRRTLLHDAGSGAIVGTLSAGEDVTKRRRAERALTHLGTHDQLTGLPNRLLLEDRLGAAVAEARANGDTVGLLYIDLMTSVWSTTRSATGRGTNC